MPTDKMFTRFPRFDPITTNYTGGQNILDQDPQSERYIHFEATRKLFKTKVVDTYKIQAWLSFYSSNIYHLPKNINNTRSNYHRQALEFYLDGFWSVSTSKLCMVGSATWFTKEGNPLKLNAVLKLKLARVMTLNNSLVSGILESLASPNDLDYFHPISMLGFPQVDPRKYNYGLESNEKCNVTINKINTMPGSSTSMKSLDMCTIFRRRFPTYKLEYPTKCKNCSLFGQDHGNLSTFVSLYAIQCSQEDNKVRFLVKFQDTKFPSYYQSFQPNMSLIGEGTWSGRNDGLCITACRILNPSDPLGSARVGDCSIRLTLWFIGVRSIMKTHTTEGLVWNAKLTDESGLFRMAKFQSFNHSQENYGLKYEYTQMEKVRQICPKKKSMGSKYLPNQYESEYYSFDFSVKHKNMVSRGYAVPIFVGSRAYNGYEIMDQNFGPWQEVLPSSANISTTTSSSSVNISFEINFMLNMNPTFISGISSLNLSSNDYYRVEISAEGVYDAETGQVCMVGCRNLKNASFDCEIMVKFQYSRGRESLTKGSIESLREKNDVLYFEKLDIVSLTYSRAAARESIWRMDLEIVMVLISNTLMCVFTVRQIFYLKKRAEMVNFISLLMMLVLTLGHMVPLVLNFEAIFSNINNQQNESFRSDGLLEANEVIVRIVTMVAFILQVRLLQVTWNAKKNHWVHEIRTLFVCLLMYIIGGSAMLLVNRKNTNDPISSQFSSQKQLSNWSDLRSYAGLTIDGFLLPQLILNIFQTSKGNALSYSFYIGTTFVRLMPHAYDLYRGQRINQKFEDLYIYANPRADFYSPSWDVVIVCGGLVFALIVFLQQRFGGRFMFPKRFQGHVEYEMVPVTSKE